MADMEWGFHYSGPKEPTDDPKCVTCNAARSKECPAHGLNYARGCAHCNSAQGQPCQAHWGLKAALDNHPVPPGGEDDFGLFRMNVEGEPVIKDAKRVYITGRASRVGIVRELQFLIRPL